MTALLGKNFTDVTYITVELIFPRLYGAGKAVALSAALGPHVSALASPSAGGLVW